MTCNDDHLDCYVIDSSGYVVVSYNNSNTGRFLGEVQPDVMSSMLEENIFERLTIYDYQAVCFYQDKDELEEDQKQKCECPKTNNTNTSTVKKCECYNSTTMKPAVNYSDPCYEGPIPNEMLETTTVNPQNVTGDLQNVTGDPQNVTGSPQSVTGDPQKVSRDEKINVSEGATEIEEEVEEERHCPCDKRIWFFFIETECFWPSEENSGKQVSMYYFLILFSSGLFKKLKKITNIKIIRKKMKCYNLP